MVIKMEKRLNDQQKKLLERNGYLYKSTVDFDCIKHENKFSVNAYVNINASGEFELSCYSFTSSKMEEMIKYQEDVTKAINLINELNQIGKGE